MQYKVSIVFIDRRSEDDLDPENDRNNLASGSSHKGLRRYSHPHVRLRTLIPFERPILLVLRLRDHGKSLANGSNNTTDLDEEIPFCKLDFQSMLCSSSM